MLRVLNKECTSADNYFAIDLLNRIGAEYVREGKDPPKFWANVMLAIPGETREDAFDTLRMVRAMDYCQLSPAFYAPYPGSALGYQLIAEGNSLLTKENYHRYPHDEKVAGVDYEFYRDLLAGKYDAEIDRRPIPACIGGKAPGGNRFYLFEMRNGRRKLAYGATPADALATLRARLSADALALIDADRYRIVKQRDLQLYIGELG
jgi:hypothetical protein